MPKKAVSKTVKKAAVTPVAPKIVKAAAKPVKKAAAPTKVAKAPVAKTKPAKASKPAKAVKVAKGVPAKAVKAAPAKAVKAAPAKAVKASKTGPKKGRGRITSPSGPLSDAVVSVLKRVRRPLSCSEITDALIKKNYQFTHPDPKRIVSIRIYKLKGVKQTGPGRFTASEV